MVRYWLILCLFVLAIAPANAQIKWNNPGSGKDKSAIADNSQEFVMVLAWAHSQQSKPTPVIEAVDRLKFPKDRQVAEGEALLPTIEYNDMTDDYIMKGREKLNIRLLDNETISIQGRVEVFRNEFVTIDDELSRSSNQLTLPINDKEKLLVFLHVPNLLQEEWRSECGSKIDKNVPQVTTVDCKLKQVSRNIKVNGGVIKSHHLASRDAGMTVTGFPGDEKERVLRFQTITGVCAKNDFDCRPENVQTKHVRSEVTIPIENRKRAKAGDTTVVEYDLYVPRNPNIDLITEYGDWFNFGQLHGHGDEDVPITVAVVREDPRVKLVEGGKRSNASPTPGSLAVYLRSIVFEQVLRHTSRNSAIVLAGPGEFEDRWMRIRIEVQWETTKNGRIDIRLDGKKVFECSKCVTLPVHRKAAVRNGKKGKQAVSFQFGIYSWRLYDKALLYSETEPPLVVAYYKNVSWEKR